MNQVKRREPCLAHLKVRVSCRTLGCFGLLLVHCVIAKALGVGTVLSTQEAGQMLGWSLRNCQPACLPLSLLHWGRGFGSRPFPLGLPETVVTHTSLGHHCLI